MGVPDPCASPALRLLGEKSWPIVRLAVEPACPVAFRAHCRSRIPP